MPWHMGDLNGTELELVLEQIEQAKEDAKSARSRSGSRSRAGRRR